MRDIESHNPAAMLLVHRAFRRDFGALPTLFAAVAGTDRRAAARVGAHATELLTLLQAHERAEENLVWPVLRTRIDPDARLGDRMRAQHERIDDLASKAEPILDRWGRSADELDRDELVDLFGRLYVALDEHLDDEEARVLPLAARTLAPAQWTRVTGAQLDAVRRRRRPIALARALGDADVRERHAFLSVIRPADRLAFQLFGRRAHHRELHTLQRLLNQPTSSTNGEKK